MFFLCLPTGVSAQTGISVLPANLYQSGGNAGVNATATPITITGQPFSQGYRVAVVGTSKNIGDAGLSWPTVHPINQGDNLQITFWVRKIEPLDGNNIRGFVEFQQIEKPYTKSLSTPFPCDSDVWTKYVISFKAAANFAVGQAQLTFQFAHGPQIFEIGGINLVNLGPTLPAPSSGKSVLPENVYQSHYYYLDGKVGGAVRTITIDGQSFNQGYEITHYGDSDFVYRSGLGWKNALPIAKNDTMLLTFWARKLQPVDNEVIRAQIVFERASGNFEKSLSTSFPNDGDQWRLYCLPFRSSTDFAPGEAQLVFQFAYGPQKFEIGGISLVNYGQGIRIDQLPSSYYYPTRGDANAAWRISANNRIDQYRKGNLTIIVHDRDGKIVPGAEIYVQQTNHAYRFGSAVTAARLMGSGTDNEIYRSRVTSHFTTTVFENDLKWGPWECATCTNFNKAQTRAAINWLAENGLHARGHNLIWPSWSFMPTETRNLSADDLRQTIDARFNDVLRDTGINGKLYHWDVINEPYSNYDVMGRIDGVEGIKQTDGVLPNAEMIRWFQMARNLDPKAALFVNDYDILAGGGQELRHQDYLFTLTKWLLDNGAPVDGVGMQGHFNRVTAPSRMEKIVERFSQLPVALAVTEFDFDVLDEGLQADYMRDVMRMIFSQSKFDDFLMWGFWERSHWLPDGAMYRADWSSKPSALVWNDLLYREWWTNETGVSNEKGQLSIRGFKGSYNVTVVYGRLSQTIPTAIGENGELTVVLDTTLPRAPIKRGGGRKVGGN